MSTLTKNDIAAKLSSLLAMPKPDAIEFVNEFFNLAVKVLSSKDDLKLSGFGTFVVHHKKARPGRNPKSGEPKEISERNIIKFKEGVKLKQKLKKDDRDDWI